MPWPIFYRIKLILQIYLVTTNSDQKKPPFGGSPRLRGRKKCDLRGVKDEELQFRGLWSVRMLPGRLQPRLQEPAWRVLRLPDAGRETRSHRECWGCRSAASSAGLCPRHSRRWAACRIRAHG